MLAKDSIGDRNDLEISAVVLFSLSSVRSSEPFAAGFSGSKKPVGFLSDVINSIFKIASSAIYKPPAKPALGSSDKFVSKVFILSISTPWSLIRSETNSFKTGS